MRLDTQVLETKTQSINGRLNEANQDTSGRHRQDSRHFHHVSRTLKCLAEVDSGHACLLTSGPTSCWFGRRRAGHWSTD